MSQDIRSYFLSSKQNLKTNNITKNKSSVIISDEDEKHASSLKDIKSVNYNKKKNNDNKSRSKKRTISSDEDEIEVNSTTKNKKVKIKDVKCYNNLEKLVEISDKSEDFFNKKPVKRINAVKINKHRKKTIKNPMLNHKVDFMSEDDDFDATLNQLDTSQIEDEYLSTINNESSSYSTFKLENIDDSNKNFSNNQQNLNENIQKILNASNHKEKDKIHSKEEKKEELLEKNSKIKNINNFNKTDSTLNENEMINVLNPTLADEIKSKSHTDYNEIIQKKVQQKKHNAILYQNYLNRGGARNPGSKEIPQGADQCLANMSFLITGVLDSLEREEADKIIKQYGGKIVHSVSKKLNYIIIGDEPGPSKLAKAESLGIKKITEDDLLDLIRTNPVGVNYVDRNKDKREVFTGYDDETKRLISKDILESSKKVVKNKNMSSKFESNTISSPTKISKIKIEVKREKSPSKNKNTFTEMKTANKDVLDFPLINHKLVSKSEYGINSTTALVEKYRPKELKQIIGQNGEKSNAKKLQYWLANWYKNHGKHSKTLKPKYSSRDDIGSIYKAVLLSGPPGIGKTTTAYVVSAQLGYEILEFNASDTRSKKLLQDEILSILSNKTIKPFFKNILNKNEIHSRHVLLMDEVDGMTGNEDRGGMQELIAFIKSTEVPIICICNDRNNQKMKTLANYTFDLRFPKPRLEQIRAAMMSLCFKEGIKVTAEELTLIIQSTNQDIRQVINHIAVLSAKTQTIKENTEKTKYKNLKLGPWDVVRKVFSSEEHKIMNIHDKSNLFFHDYNIAALFVEENYPIVTPSGSKNELCHKLANCSESLAIGDTIENSIKVHQTWNLLPVQACFSSVIPGSVMSGFFNSQINFPSWLGKNSKRIKYDRLLQDITIHTRITTGTNKEAINLDYLKLLVDSIIRPMLIAGIEGVDQAVNVMNNYHLTREDFDSLIELTKWPHTRDPMQSIDSKTKAVFNKTYNKSSLFSSGSTTKKKNACDIQNENYIKSDDEEVSDYNDDKIENDKLIKAKISKTKSTLSKNKPKTKNITKVNKISSKKK
jgi:replication factor C subunit 1